MKDLKERTKALYAIRTNLGWSPADVATKLDVSPRLVSMWETGTHDIPDGRWRLFMHEVNAEIKRGSSIVVILDVDGETPIDAVSDVNFYDIKINNLEGYAVISSYVIDRFTQRPNLHATRFRIEGNEHVVRTATAWEAALRVGASTGEKEMLIIHRWLTNRILKTEQSNPRLRELKNDIAAASESVDLAPDDGTKRELLDALDHAVFALIHEIEQSKV